MATLSVVLLVSLLLPVVAHGHVERALGHVERAPKDACLLQYSGNVSRQTVLVSDSEGAARGGAVNAPESEPTPAKAEAEASTVDDAAAPVDSAAENATITAAQGGVPEFEVDPNWALRVELHLPTGLRELHAGPQGPITKFLAAVRQEFSAAASMPLSRVVVLDVRGDNLTLSMAEIARNTPARLLELLPAPPPKFVLAQAQQQHRAEPKAESKGSTDFDCSAGLDKWQEGWSDTKKEWCCTAEGRGCSPKTIVDMEVLPGSMQDPAPMSAFVAWQKQLNETDSYLQQGPLAELLGKAEVVSGREPTGPGPSRRAGPDVGGDEMVAVVPIEGGARRAALGTCGAFSVVLSALSLMLRHA